MRKRLVVFLSAFGLVGALCAIPGVAGAAPTSGGLQAVCGVTHSTTYAECFAMVRTGADGAPIVSATPEGYSPQQFHTAYNLPDTTAAAKTQTIALVDAYADPNIKSDLATYDSTEGLPVFKECTSKTQKSCFAVLNEEGKVSPLPGGDSDWGLEESLDVEVSHAICPTCRIVLFEANSNSFSDLATAVDTAASLGATEISNSYGSYEDDCSPSEAPGYNHPNIAVTVSAGDYDAGVACPAVQNTVVAVGGTSLYLNSNGSYNYETVWNTAQGEEGTGGGCSTANTAQSWQTAVSTWAEIGCGSGRGMNDVSADADPYTGAAVYDSYGYGGWIEVGGTSLASPLTAGVYGLAGNASSVAYPAQLAYENAGDLHDVTQGNDGTCGVQCNALTGYDLPTGLGSPNGLGAY